MSPFALPFSFCGEGSLRHSTGSFYPEIEKDRFPDRWTAAIAVCSGAISYQSDRTAVRLNRRPGHLAALIGAVAAGLSTLLTMIMIILVLFTLRGTGIANFRTKFADTVGKLRVPAHQSCGCPTECCAVAIRINAVGHFRNVRFTQTSVGTVFAFLCTFNTGFDTRLEFFVRH